MSYKINTQNTKSKSMKVSHGGKKMQQSDQNTDELEFLSKERLMMLIPGSCCLNSAASELIRACYYASYQSLFTQRLKTDPFDGMARWLTSIVRFLVHAKSVVRILHPASKILSTTQCCHPKSEGLSSLSPWNLCFPLVLESVSTSAEHILQ